MVSLGDIIEDALNRSWCDQNLTAPLSIDKKVNNEIIVVFAISAAEHEAVLGKFLRARIKQYYGFGVEFRVMDSLLIKEHLKSINNLHLCDKLSVGKESHAAFVSERQINNHSMSPTNNNDKAPYGFGRELADIFKEELPEPASYELLRSESKPLRYMRSSPSIRTIETNALNVWNDEIVSQIGCIRPLPASHRIAILDPVEYKQKGDFYVDIGLFHFIKVPGWPEKTKITYFYMDNVEALEQITEENKTSLFKKLGVSALAGLAFGILSGGLGLLASGAGLLTAGKKTVVLFLVQLLDGTCLICESTPIGFTQVRLAFKNK